MVGERAEETQDDDLACSGVPADPNLGVEPGRSPTVGRDDDDDAARVLAGRVIGRLDGPVRVILVGDDDEGQDPRQRHRADVVAQGDHLLGDLGGRRTWQVDDHGSLHSRPSRRIISSADVGPHPPAG